MKPIDFLEMAKIAEEKIIAEIDELTPLGYVDRWWLIELKEETGKEPLSYDEAYDLYDKLPPEDHERVSELARTLVRKFAADNKFTSFAFDDALVILAAYQWVLPSENLEIPTGDSTLDSEDKLRPSM